MASGVGVAGASGHETDAQEAVMGELTVYIPLGVEEISAAKRDEARGLCRELFNAEEWTRAVVGSIGLAVLDALDERDAEGWIPSPGDWFIAKCNGMSIGPVFMVGHDHEGNAVASAGGTAWVLSLHAWTFTRAEGP